MKLAMEKRAETLEEGIVYRLHLQPSNPPLLLRSEFLESLEASGFFLFSLGYSTL